MSDSKVCVTCKKEFSRQKRVGVKKFASQRFCSRTCVRRELNPNVKSPYHQTKRMGRRIDIHRANMEDHLGRRLGRFEFVHHKNENKKDNRLENLKVVTPKEHAAEHGQQKHPLTKPCQICQTIFTPHPTKRARAKTCSPECNTKLMSLIHRKPDKPNSMYREDAYPCRQKNRK